MTPARVSASAATATSSDRPAERNGRLKNRAGGQASDALVQAHPHLGTSTLISDPRGYIKADVPSIICIMKRKGKQKRAHALQWP
jgi:hypothetical protein